MNQAAQVDWVSGIVVLVIGAVIGIAVYWWSSRRKSEARAVTTVAPSLEVRDLDAKYEALIRQLRELEDLSSTRTPEQLAHERYALELEAARALRSTEKEKRKQAPEISTVPAAATAPPGSSGISGFLWGAGSMAAIAALIFFVNSAANDRSGGMTGGMAPAGAQQQQGEMPHPEIGALKQRVEKNPQDLEARVDLAQAYLITDDLMATFEQTQFVLEREPQNARALSYEAIVRLAMGDSAGALSQLELAIQSDPTLLDGWVHKVLVLASLGRMDEAENTIVEAERRFPQQAQTFGALRNHIRTEFTGQPPMQPAQAPMSQAPASAPRAAASGERVSGMLQLDARAGSNVSLPAVVWIMARPAGTAEGAPIAVSRMIVQSFPVTFSLGPEHAMMGGSLADPLRIDVRIDPDGNPETKDEGAPFASMDPVHLGVNDLKIVLR